MGLGGRLGPDNASGGGGGGGMLGGGGDQFEGGSSGALTNDGGVEQGLSSLGGGGLAGFKFLARIMVGLVETLTVTLTALCLLRGSSLLNSKGTEFSDRFETVSTDQGSAAVGVDEFDISSESKSSSKPLSTCKK